MNDVLVDEEEFYDEFMIGFVKNVIEVRQFMRRGVVESLRAKDAMYQGAILIRDEQQI